MKLVRHIVSVVLYIMHKYSYLCLRFCATGVRGTAQIVSDHRSVLFYPDAVLPIRVVCSSCHHRWAYLSKWRQVQL